MLKPYGAEINLAVDNAHTRVLRMVGAGVRVLELGCGVGHMTRVLLERGCTVTGIEINPTAAAQAAETGSPVIVADVETLDWAAALGNRRFDVVISADVLEHLRDPGAVLRAARGYLADGGIVVASIPNVAHVSVLAQLLQGRFEYQPVGLLDDTHVHFFTRNSVYECFEGAGFEITALERIVAEPEETEFRTDLSCFPPDVATFLRSREEARTYQFVLTARPVPGRTFSGLTRLPQAGRSPIHASTAPLADGHTPAADGFLQAVAARWMVVEDERNHALSLNGRLREQLLKAETHIGWLTSELARANAAVDSGQSALQTQTAGMAQNETTAVEQTVALTSEMERTRAENEALRTQIRITASELALRTEERDRLARDLADVGRDLCSIEEARRDAGQQLEAVRIERTRHADQIRRADEALGRRLLDERFRMAAELEILRQERDSFTPSLDVLNQAIAVFQHSSSWRITAPLRWGGRIVRRLRTLGRS